MSDQPSALLSAGRVRRNSAGDEAAVQGREAGGASHMYPDYPPDYPTSRDESQELSYGDLQYSTHSESTVQYSERGSERGSAGSRERLAPPPASSTSDPVREGQLRQRPGLIRPQPLYHGDSSSPQYLGEREGYLDTAKYQPPSTMPPIRRFSTEADIHHAAPLNLEEGFQDQGMVPSIASALPPYRAPPHLYHPRDRLQRLS